MCQKDANATDNYTVQHVQLMLTKHARRVWRSVKVIKHGTVRYVWYGFLKGAIVNLVAKMCHCSDKRQNLKVYNNM